MSLKITEYKTNALINMATPVNKNYPTFKLGDNDNQRLIPKVEDWQEIFTRLTGIETVVSVSGTTVTLTAVNFVPTLRTAADDTAAAALSPAIPVGGMYVTAAGDVRIRVV